MNRRLRLLSALLALFAFSAYFAEGVWASLCLPGAESHVMVGHGPADHGPDAAAHHGPSQSESEPVGSDTPPCPLAMTGAGGGCVALSLPAVVDAVAPALPAPQVAALQLDSTHDRLLVAQHFRPPRA